MRAATIDSRGLDLMVDDKQSRQSCKLILQGLIHLVFADQLSILIADANSKIICASGARAEGNFVADRLWTKAYFYGFIVNLLTERASL